MECSKCSLGKLAFNPCMFGKGRKNSKIMIIADYPSLLENKKDRVFTGKKRELFKDSLEKRGINLDDIYFTYAIKCPIDKDSKPTISQANACKEYLDAEIEVINPEIIVPLGNMALKSILGKVGITKLRGRAEKHGKRIILPIYDPKVTSTLPGYKSALFKDMDTLASLYKEGLNISSSLDYTIVETMEVFEEEMDKLEKTTGRLAFDIETTGTEIYTPKSKIVCVSFSNAPGTGCVIPLYHRQSPFKTWELGYIVKRIRKLLENPSIEKVAHNGKFDMEWLEYWLGIKVSNFVFDTILSHYLAITEERGTHDLKTLAWEFTDMGGYDNALDEYKASLPEVERNNYDNIPWSILSLYGCADADCCLRLVSIFEPLIEENPKWKRIMNEILIPASYAIKDVQNWGMHLDRGVANQYTQSYDEEIKRLYEKLHGFPEVLEIERDRESLFNQRQLLLKTVPAKQRNEEQKEFIKKTAKHKNPEFNFNSVIQLRELLFDKLELETTIRTDKGEFSTNEDALEEMKDQHSIPFLLLENRKVTTLNNMFVVKLPSLVDEYSIVHPSFNLIGTVTGRSSSDNPNAQQFPRSVEDPLKFQYKNEIKRLFSSRFGDSGCILQADYSQLELRIAGVFSQDRKLTSIYLSGEDLHIATASEVWKVPIEAVTKSMRTDAKAVNFGIIYGKSGFTFARDLYGDLSWKEAKKKGFALVEDYLNTFKDLAKWIEDTKAFAMKHGYSETLFGRRRRLPNLKSRDKFIQAEAIRQAVNAPIQGTGSDMTILSLVVLTNWIKENNLKSKLICTVHDSIVFDIYIPELPLLYPKIKEVMENIHLSYFDTEIPIVADIEVGRNYGELFEMSPQIVENLNSNKKFLSWIEENSYKKHQKEIEFLREKHKFSDKQIKEFFSQVF